MEVVARDVYAGIGRKGSLSGGDLELYAAKGALAWSPGLDGWWSLVSHKQEGISAIDFKVGDGREIFATNRDGPDAGEIVAVDLHSGKQRKVARISGWEGAGYELESSRLAVDSTHVYFLARAGSSGPSIFRVRRDGSGRPESLGAGPWAWDPRLEFVVHDGHAYWFENKEGEPPGIVQRTLEFGSQPIRVANAASSPFHIANGRVYFVNDDAIWSVQPDGSELTKHVEVGPEGASHILLDRGCLYWTNDTEIRRAKLSDGSSKSSEIIADDRTYRGQSNMATDGKSLYWFDLRQDRILRLGRDAASLTPRPRLVAKSVPYQEAPRVREAAHSIFVGESWACADTSVRSAGHWRCWEEPPRAGTAPVAIPNQSMDALFPFFASDRVCAEVRDQIRCWPGRDFARKVPDNPVVKPGTKLQGRGSLLLGGTFTCMFGPQVDRYQNPTWTCQGDNRFHQFAGFESTVSPRHLALGTWHTCEKTNSGMPNCWGRADGGQLGFTPRETCHVDGKAVACSRGGHKVPFQVPAGSGPLLAGDMFTCAVSYREVSCWGASRDGWIGTASACPAHLKAQWPTTAGFVRAPNAACSPTPAVVRAFEGFQVHSGTLPPISVGPRGACAIIDKHIRCVGAIPTPSTEVTTVVVNAGNRANACGIADSRVVCWGEGYSPKNVPSAAVEVNRGPSLPADAAIVDFAAPDGKSWPEPYLIHRDCALPARTIPKCPAGTTGEPWSSLLVHAPALVGQRVSVRDRLFVGPPGNRNSNSFWSACSRRQPDPSHRSVACETEVQSTVLGETEPPLFLTGMDATCMGDESRLCCASPALGQTVVATGVLGREKGWFLGEPTMCEPEDIDHATLPVKNSRSDSGSTPPSPIR
jgi:hypothetical protein